MHYILQEKKIFSITKSPRPNSAIVKLTAQKYSTRNKL